MDNRHARTTAGRFRLRESVVSRQIDRWVAHVGRRDDHGARGLRGGYHEPFDPDGPEDSGPDGVAVVIWAGVAGVAVLFALSALVFSLPSGEDQQIRDFAAVEQMLARSRAEAAETLAAEGAPMERSDFSMQAGDTTDDTSLAGLQVENAALRRQVAEMGAEIDDLSRRMLSLEDSLRSVTGSVGRRPPERPAAQDGVGGPAIAPDPALEARQAGPDRRNAPFGVELGTFADIASAERAWRDLLAASPGLLGDLRPVATLRDGGGRTDLLLVAGPFPTAAAAAARCSLAEQAGIACLPAFYVGQPLAVR